MIGLFKDDDTRLVVSYNGLNLNASGDADDDTYELNNIFTTEVLNSVTEADSDDDGTEAYGVRKASRIIRIEGMIRAPTIAKLYDKTKALLAAFDAAKVAHENPTTQGFLPLDFFVPTLDTANYATGLVPSRYYARARSSLVPLDSTFTGLSAPFTLELLCADPRRYLQAGSTQTGAAAIANTKADYRSFPTLTITMAGAGNAAYTVARAHTLATKTLVLNLSGTANNDVVVVDMAKKRITKNTVEAPSLYVSGVFFEMEPGTNTMTYTNPTNATSVLVWRPAFCA